MIRHQVVNDMAVVVVSAAELEDLLQIAEKYILKEEERSCMTTKNSSSIARQYVEIPRPGARLFDRATFEFMLVSQEINYRSGVGYWTKNGLESTYEVFESEPEDATHVSWYSI